MLKKKLFIFITLVCLISFIQTVKVSSQYIYDYNTGLPLSYVDGNYITINNYTVKESELRGVWVATISNIDIKVQNGVNDYEIEQYKKEYIKILETMKQYHMNAIFFQVRPLNDAFYKSELNPWSRYLIGTEGKDPGWDPLSWMIDVTHDYGIEFHAWFNPYRVANSTKLSKDAYLKTLDEMNFARVYPNLVLNLKDTNGNNQLILNPGEPKVQEFITETIMEVVTNYDIDAVHFDDYFYPYNNIGSSDLNTYNTYKIGSISLEDWRRENVNQTIRGIKELLLNYDQETGRYVQFGISPFGVWANKSHNPLGSNTNGLQTYYDQYADTYKWIKEEWIDYVIPQIYWDFTHRQAPYGELVKWWSEVVKGTNVNLYIGLALYRYGESGNWLNSNETMNQILFNQGYPEIKGNVLYSYRYLTKTDQTLLTNAREKVLNLWEMTKPTLPNVLGQEYKPASISITNAGQKLNFDIDIKAKYYEVYQNNNLLFVTESSSISIENKYPVTIVVREDLRIIQKFEITPELIQLIKSFPTTIEVNSEMPNWSDLLNENVDQLLINESYMDLNKIGIYDLIINTEIHDDIKITINHKVKVIDSIKPVIYNHKDFILPVYSKNINWYDSIVVIDNYDGVITEKLLVDDSKVNLDKVGNYDLTYQVEDQSGNLEKIEVNVKVIQEIPYFYIIMGVIFLLIVIGKSYIFKKNV